ncbi:conserved domain protein [Parvimonas sp. oral taxon 393 str. F0440]|nr:conserved domain protein [Parvimonas sp. oral taxon 393 str. F0440]
MGMFLAVALKAKTETKTMVGLGCILLMNYTSGMMGSSVTNAITSAFPIIKKINPTFYMENALLGVNIANDNSYLITMAKFIIPFTIILFGIALIYLRRHKYNDI